MKKSGRVNENPRSQSYKVRRTFRVRRTSCTSCALFYQADEAAALQIFRPPARSVLLGRQVHGPQIAAEEILRYLEDILTPLVAP